MQAVAQVTGEAQRGLFERLLDKEAERLRRQGVELDRALAKIVKAEQA